LLALVFDKPFPYRRMLDIKLIRDHPDTVRERLAVRGAGDEVKLDELIALDVQLREKLRDVEQLKAQRNQASKEIGALMGQKKLAEAEAKKAEVRAIGDRAAALDKEIAATEAARDNLLLTLPNLPHASVALGKSSEDNPVVRVHGDKPQPAFTPKNHIELCESLGLIDFQRAAKLSGSGFLLYTHLGARLERALINYLIELHTGEHGYTEVAPPFIVNRDVMTGVGQFPKFTDQAFWVRRGVDDETMGKQFLIPTAEAPVANIHREEILPEAKLPIYYCAYSPCFRAEAGAAGLGTRGMIRVHQFDKVELIKIVKPDDGYAELEKMVANAETVLQRLGLHYRVIQLCTGDMGFASAMTYDIEVWAPGQGTYLEVSSCSNCEDFQSRRMGLRFKSAQGQNIHPHLLNGSGTALARLFVALLETHQQPDGSVRIPEPLQPWMKTDCIRPPQ
jgi:seryl-tRNA synthetase